MYRTLNNETFTPNLVVGTVSTPGVLTAASLTVPNSITASATTTEFFFNTLTVPFVEATTVSASAGMTLPVYSKANKPSTGAVGQIICISDAPAAGTPAFWSTTGTPAWTYFGVGVAVPAS
jgi:hypothetical protein